jgi:hypothetical protein
LKLVCSPHHDGLRAAGFPNALSSTEINVSPGFRRSLLSRPVADDAAWRLSARTGVGARGRTSGCEIGLHLASAACRLQAPLLTVLPGVGLDPCQRLGVPLVCREVLHIRFDHGVLLLEKFRFRKMRLRKIADEIAKELQYGVI